MNLFGIGLGTALAAVLIGVRSPPVPAPAVTLIGPTDDTKLSAPAGETLAVDFTWAVGGEYDEVYFGLEKGDRFERSLKRTKISGDAQFHETFDFGGTYRWYVEAVNTRTGATYRASAILRIKRGFDSVVAASAAQNFPRPSDAEPAPAAPPVAVAAANFDVPATPAPRTDFARSFWIALGAGTNVGRFAQSSSRQQEISFTSVGGAVYSARGGYDLGRFGVELATTRASGRIEVSGLSKAESQATVTRRSTELEGKYSVLPTPGDHGFGVAAVAGARREELPYFTIVRNVLGINAIDVIAASLGLDLNYRFTRRYRVLMNLRYLPVLSSRDQNGFDFQPQNQSQYEAAVGGDVQLSRHFSLGVVGTGSVYENRFSLGGGAAADRGNVDQFLGTFELRALYRF